jgi:hypothetical protein
MKLIAVIYHDNYYNFFTIFVNSYNNGLLPLIRQFLLIPNRIKELSWQIVMLHLLLESVLPGFNHYLAILTFQTLQ